MLVDVRRRYIRKTMVDGTLLRDIGYDTIDRIRMENGCWPLQRSDQMSEGAGWFAGEHYRTGQSHSTDQRFNQLECVGGMSGIHLEGMMRKIILDFMADEPHRRILIEQGVDIMGVGTHVEELRNSYYYLIVVVRVKRTG